MKRPIKPFVVEVRKGQKRSGTPEFMPKPDKIPEDDAVRRAEALLFAPQPSPDSDDGPAAGRTGRILESIPAPGTEEASSPLEEEALPRRRGRPPGSKNKLKSEAAAAKPARRRGRPPRIPEGSVRQVAVTPELTSAALEAIARVQPPPMPAMPVRVASPTPRYDAPVKRKRGRPRKIDLANPAPATRPAGATPPGLSVAPSAGSPSLPLLLRAALEAGAGQQEAIPAALTRTRAGERWKRRLRGAALRAFERKSQRQA
jgi:hypothetical protein